MNTNGKFSRSGRYQPIPDYTPLFGVKQYVSESKFLLTFIVSVAYTLVYLRMALIEQSASGGFMPLLGIGAALLLATGGLFTLIGAAIKRSPGIIIFSGLLMLLASVGMFSVTVALESLYERSFLGVIQIVFEVLLFAGILILLLALIVSCLNKRTAPSAGYFATIISVFAFILLLIRTLTTFASLFSALGTDFSWDYASDLTGEIAWALKTVESTSQYSEQMFYARLFERIALLFLLLSAFPPIFSFAPFFRQYNMQMEISNDIPANRIRIEQMEAERRRERESRGSLAGLRSLRPPKKEMHLPEIKPEDIEEADEQPVDGYCGPDYIDGFDLFDDRLVYEQPYYAPHVYTYNNDSFSDNSDNIDEPELTDTSLPERNPETGAFKVQLTRSKPTLPNPNDESIWFHYTDDSE